MIVIRGKIDHADQPLLHTTVPLGTLVINECVFIFCKNAVLQIRRHGAVNSLNIGVVISER